MSKRVFLYVSGDDFSAMHFDQEYSQKEKQEIYNNMVSEGKTLKIIDKDELYAEIRILEFDEIDNNFLAFVFDNFVDYDVAKSKDIFEVEAL
ncbi:MAG: hypothetical protein ABS939_08285 [Psychrobacillus sp.]